MRINGGRVQPRAFRCLASLVAQSTSRLLVRSQMSSSEGLVIERVYRGDRRSLAGGTLSPD